MAEKLDGTEKFNDSIENKFDDDDVESDNIAEAFICCICRDLLYKPVVLACGHISCFWCVHKSMSGLYKSRCPICRNQYFHFPYICQKLHLMLLKLYPVAYERRGNQTLEEEKQMECFSPQINGPPLHQLHSEKTKTKPSDASMPCFSEASPSPNPYVFRTGETLGMKEHVQSGSMRQELGLAALIEHRNDTAVTSTTLGENRNSDQTQNNGPSKLVSLDDVQCDSCNLMLFRPIVLNCGHAFCFCCIESKKDEVLKCPTCECPHPGDVPKVCLELDHFLEEQFPDDYEQRRGTFQMKLEQCCNVELSKSTTKNGFHFSFSPGEDPFPWLNSSSNVHIGVGCDSCGMYPLIGDRYRCKDCPEKIGYDLCKDCYTTSSKLPGRFNQQHTSEHKFEIVKSSEMHELMLSLIRGQLQEPSAVLIGSMNVNPAPNNANEDHENVADPPLPPSETESPQSENQ